MEKDYIVYKHTSPSGGVYIGQTHVGVNERARDGKAYMVLNKETGEFLQPALAKAILKYGWDNFTHEVLYSGLTSEEADEKETELIEEAKGTGICYNICSGGKSGVPGANEHKIKQYTLSGEYVKTWNSIKEAEEFVGIKRAQANISACCQGKKHRAYGYVWRYEEDNTPIKPLTPYRAPICQYTKTGDYIATYQTIREASQSTGIGETSIGNNLRGWSKSAGGFFWKFAD